MRTRSTNWVMAVLVGATVAMALPFLAFVIFTVVAPDSPVQSARANLPVERTVTAARPSPAANRTVAPGEAVRKRRT